jgi:RNA polymerase sigma-32 factor
LTLQEGDLRPDEVTLVANRLRVTEQDVIEMNRRLSGDVSLNAPLNVEGDPIEWQDRLIDESSDQETRLAERDDSEHRRRALGLALTALDKRERYIFEARRLFDPPLSLAELAIKFRVPPERIRQIEARAFETVRSATRDGMVRAWSS